MSEGSVCLNQLIAWDETGAMAPTRDCARFHKNAAAREQATAVFQRLIYDAALAPSLATTALTSS